MERDKQPLIPEQPGSSPNLKSFYDLSDRIKAMVSKEAVNYVGL
jgi:hypothetical protein